MSETSDDFNRGHAAGTVDEQLREHSQRLDRINGTIIENTAALNRVDMKLTKLTGTVDANAAAVIAAAEMIKQSGLARTSLIEQMWLPRQRWLAVAAVIISLGSLLLAIVVSRS